MVSLTEYILDTDQHKCWPYNVDVFEIRKLIASMCYIYMKQQANKTLNSRQGELATHYDLLQRLLKDANVIRRASDSTDVYPYWTILKQRLDLSNSDDTLILIFEDRSKGREILDTCNNILELMNGILQPKKTFPAIYRWLTNDMLGSLDQAREELCARYDGKNIKLQVAKNISLDCMFLPGRQENSLNQSSFIAPGGRSGVDESTMDIYDHKTDMKKFSNPTIIFCNPNAGFYELMYYESEWIEFYVNRGVNVFVWNYRGYSRSGGKPHPKSMKSDAESIVKYLRNEYGIKKIGVHGESLGGLPVCHLAKHGELDFACADRTFSALTTVAHYSFGKYAGKIYRLMTGWADDNCGNFIEAPCYKVVTFDPKDEVIPFQSSLRAGITQKVVQKLLGIDSDHLTSSKKKGVSFTPGGLSLLKVKFMSKFQAESASKGHKSVSEYSELLNPNQANALFYALKRLLLVFNEVSKTDPVLQKGHRKSQSIGAAPEPRRSIKQKKKKQQGGRGSLDSSMDELTADRTSGDDAEEDSPIINQENSKMNNTNLLDALNNHHEETKHQDDILKDKASLQREYPISIQENKAYISLLEEEDRSSSEFQNFIFKLFTLLGMLEAGGIYLLEGISKPNMSLILFRVLKKTFCQLIMLTKEFLISLEIWGSTCPNGVPSEEVPRSGDNQKESLNRIYDFVMRWDKIVNGAKPRIKRELQTALYEDLEIVSNLFATIYHNLTLVYNRNFAQNSSFRGAGRINIGKENHQALDINTNDYAVLCSPNTVGHVLLLSGGHNGCLNKNEVLIYEALFRNSNFI